MKLKASVYMSQPFAKSLLEVMNIKRLPPTVKFNLVKLKKSIGEEIQTLKDSSEGMDDKEFTELIKSVESEFEFEKFNAKLITDLVTANDLCNLEPIMEVMND